MHDESLPLWRSARGIAASADVPLARRVITGGGAAIA